MRILIATRRYWPLVGGAEVLLRRFAAELVRQGHAVTVVTQRWEARQPERETDGGVAIERLSVPQVRWLGTVLYMRRLARWLARRRSDVDVCYTSMLKHTAYVTCRVGRRLGIPVILRPECKGPPGGVGWQRGA